MAELYPFLAVDDVPSAVDFYVRAFGAVEGGQRLVAPDGREVALLEVAGQHLGVATEAAAAIRDWAYKSRSIDLLVSLISPNNVRSQRVAERLGATPTETVTPAHTKQKTVVWRHRPAA